jgi:hypothetical protein
MLYFDRVRESVHVCEHVGALESCGSGDALCVAAERERRGGRRRRRALASSDLSADKECRGSQAAAENDDHANRSQRHVPRWARFEVKRLFGGFRNGSRVAEHLHSLIVGRRGHSPLLRFSSKWDGPEAATALAASPKKPAKMELSTFMSHYGVRNSRRRLIAQHARLD